MVEPRMGRLVHSPSFSKGNNEEFVTKLKGKIDKENEKLKNFFDIDKQFIRIDNDCRCATRWQWKKYYNDKKI
jgi:hypothetical protein